MTPLRVWPALLGWAVTRAAVVLLLCTSERGVFGDVRYYHDSLAALSSHGVAGTLVEYPVPAFVLLWVPYALLRVVSAGSLYTALIPVLAGLIDLAYFGFLLRSRRWRPPAHTFGRISLAEWIWILAVPALGATSYARFDLIPGVFVGLAVLYVVHRPALAAVFGALATGVKYWPAIVLPVIAAPRTGRARVLGTILAAGAVLALGSLVLGGSERLFSPFDYQDQRGLQVESVAAVPAMVAWSHGGAGYAVQYASSKAYEVSGPMVDRLLGVATVATVLVALVLVVLCALAWRRIRDGERGVDALVWLALAAISGFMVTSKVLSPQYLLWLMPAAAAGLVVMRSAAGWRRLAWWSGLLLLAAVLTHQVFPCHYGGVITYSGGSSWIVGLLAVRDLLLLGLFGYAAVQAFLALRRMSAPSPSLGR